MLFTAYIAIKCVERKKKKETNHLDKRFYKSYLPLLNSEKIKFLKILHGDLQILMHQIIENILKNILTESFFPPKIFLYFYI